MINISDLNKPLDECICFLEEKINILSNTNDFKSIEKLLNLIREQILDYINDNNEIQELRNSCTYIKNDFSNIKNKEILEAAKKRSIENLKKIKYYIENNKLEFIDYNNSFDKYNSILILNKILNNFYLHIKAMYLDKCHGKGNIQNEQLNSIKIGNEYDVQRILYSLIKPIFPSARLEVSNDTGFSTTRYDLLIEEFSVVIEVKCSRKSMTEKKLTEEIASDIVHYKYENIFFFIYDKDEIIRDTHAFSKTYNKYFDDKKINTIIIQPISL